MRRFVLGFAPLSLVALLFPWAGCSSGGDEAPPGTTAGDPGALVETSMQSKVGVLLDDLSSDAQRDRAADALLGEPSSFWEARARAQLSLTQYRLVFRNYYYDDKGQLPLPPEDRWTITLDPSGPTRQSIDGHDLVVVDYSFTSTLLSDAESPALAEPALAEVGGVWDEPFVFPIDPELLLQRTGYACMDEAEFPPNSVDGENVATFYDQDCTADDEECHLTAAAEEDCTAALDNHVGSIATSVHYERVAWDAQKADLARSGEVTHEDGADLAVIAEGLDNHRVIYRYIPSDSCAIAEGCVGAAGWRRLLQFDASVRNLGAKALNIGDVDYFIEGNGTDLEEHNIYELSPCHNHYHFTHYGDFTFGDGSAQTGKKRAFCLQSTARYSNNESSPLVNPYGGCDYQGIEAGWGDDYGAGLDCQWVDVTDVDTSAGPVTELITFVSNPDQFLCEGTPVLDEQGAPTFEDTSFTTEQGAPVDRQVCEFAPNWDSNNAASRPATLPLLGGFTTEPCARGQVGPLRDCGFTEQRDAASLLSCSPGEAVTLDCTLPEGSAPQVLRVCERSVMLGGGVSCVYRDALANTTLAGGTTSVSLTCPPPRDALEPGGLLALYAAPELEGDALVAATCVALP